MKALRSESSIHTRVNIVKETLHWNGSIIESWSNISNKVLYKYLIKKTEESIGIKKLEKILDTKLDNVTGKKSMFFFMFTYLKENKLRVFKWKLLQYIIPTQQLLFKWKIASNNLCNFCKTEEDYLHFFITCKCFMYYKYVLLYNKAYL